MQINTRSFNLEVWIVKKYRSKTWFLFGDEVRTIFLFKYADIYSMKIILVSIVELGGAFMDITRIAAILPVTRINGFNGKDSRTDAKSRGDKKDNEFEKALKAIRVEEVGRHAYN